MKANKMSLSTWITHVDENKMSGEKKSHCIFVQRVRSRMNIYEKEDITLKQNKNSSYDHRSLLELRTNAYIHSRVSHYHQCFLSLITVV